MRILHVSHRQPDLLLCWSALLFGGLRASGAADTTTTDPSGRPAADGSDPSVILPAANNVCPKWGAAAEAGATTAAEEEGTEKTTCVVDLARPYVRLGFETEEGRAMVAMAEADRNVHSFLALECGKVVAEYYDGGIERAQRNPLHLFSVTKSWSSLLFGVMEKEGLISFDETLGDIWPDESVWANVTDAEDRKKISIEGLLQMRAGLNMTEGWQQDMLVDLLPFNDNRGGGKDFETSLTYHRLDPKKTGTYNYLPVGNLVSYVTKERTGKTPLEYAEEKVFPLLGIQEGQYDWYKNLEGVNLGFHGLKLTPDALSKIAMLYLQQGMANENDEVVTKDFVQRSFTAGGPGSYYDGGFGYMAWWLEGDKPAACTYGFGGQRACVNYETNRAIAILSQTYYQETGIEEIENPTLGTSTNQLKDLWMHKTPDEIGYPNACADEAPPAGDDPSAGADNPTVESTTGAGAASGGDNSRLGGGLAVRAAFASGLAYYYVATI